MVHGDYFVYEYANFNPRIKVPVFLDSAQVGLLKNVQSNFSRDLVSREIAKNTNAHFFLKHPVEFYHLFEARPPVLFCLYLSSPISLRKLIVLKTNLWMSPSIWDMSHLSRLIATGKIKQKLHKTLWCVFFETPCMQLCNYATMQLCNYATMQLCNYATMQLCNYAIMQLCNYATMQLCSYATKRGHAQLWKLL